ncbi:MAG: hypothetical protein E6I53_16410 [Chloroflexi bacterium]|nr:MAG: hypothetical protein E6I53_16410 [Chloroflexota bacterium]
MRFAATGFCFACMTSVRAVSCQPGLDRPSENGTPERDADSGPSGRLSGWQARARVATVTRPNRQV